MGNVVEDRQPDGGWAPGGPSLYAARTAAALGVRVTLVTCLSATYDRSALEGIAVIGIPAAETPRYANTYDASGDRTQVLLSAGDAIDEYPALPEAADALIVAPAFHEFEGRAGMPWECYRAPVRSISLQGILRAVDGEGRVSPAKRPATAIAGLVPRGAHAFFSEEDTADPVALARAVTRSGATAVVTRGYRGATMYRGSSIIQLDALDARPIDPTGAGDCFATAYTVRLAETGDITQASRYALAAGALATEGEGLAGIPDRAAIERRLSRSAA